MAKLKLIVKNIEPNGAVVMVPADPTIKDEKINKATGKAVTDAALKKAKHDKKPLDLERRRTKLHPSARFQFIPLKEDDQVYNVGDIFRIELKKV